MRERIAALETRAQQSPLLVADPSGKTMEGLSWDQFRRKIHIDASMERVYACWVTSGDLAMWFLGEASYATAEGERRGDDESTQVEDVFTWKWHNHDHRD